MFRSVRFISIGWAVIYVRAPDTIDSQASFGRWAGGQSGPQARRC
jgi:hypothetical protein